MEFLKELKRSVLTLNNEETESDSLNRGATVKEGVEFKSAVLGQCFIYCSFQSSVKV